MLIVFDGIDRAGKTTHLKLIARWLTDNGKEFILKREPGGTVLGEKIRHLFIHNTMDPMVGLFLLSAARFELTKELSQLGKKFDWKKLILCDRFVDSTYAYQGQNISKDVIDHVVALSANVKADFTFLFLHTYKSKNMSKLDETAMANKAVIVNKFVERACLDPDKYFMIPQGSIKKQNLLIQQKIAELLKEAGLW